MTGRATLACVALLVVAAGCSGIGFTGPREPPAGGDALGFEDGYWYDDSLNVTADDGLNESERRAVVARTMARVEVIRDLEFTERVPVEVVSREQYRSRSSGGSSGDATYEAWNNQVWEALLLVGEGTDVSDTFDTIFGSSVQGYYSPSRDEIVLVSNSETPTVDTRTLAHELVHALQDQHLRLSSDAETQDAQLATDGLVEGDANHVEELYDGRCDAEWDCLPTPERGNGGTPTEFNFGVFLTVFTPYAEGPALVEDLRERSGGDWDRVNEAYDDMPASTEQVIHPEKYPDDRPTNVSVRDRSSEAWHRFDVDQQADTVGEASLYAMFWANGQVDRSRSPYNYSHPLSTGWDGDAVVPYTNGSHGGYVWKATFDSKRDARQFYDGYVRALESREARSPDPGVYVIPDGPFADAFRVTRYGDTVVVVNAPTRADLSAVHG
ncbi:Hvo_1808 family surface protein [Halorarius halobius]|uniref:Hvo_1808 family surface protein n=1 Tax=Halorarius halobius TaxID=2962671 RepID=UPI0020CBB3BE|nr:Hvo_1808 family surface protein [Halorarius halobius]